MELRDELQKTFGDSYTIERELGGGGMSRVFLAVEQSLGRRVVVKMLPDETAAAVSIERFKREIRLAASLQQANIVPVLAAGDARGVPYYTMPFVKGESLRSRLATEGALPVAECVAILSTSRARSRLLTRRCGTSRRQTGEHPALGWDGGRDGFRNREGG